MFLDINELERERMALDQAFPPGRIDFGEDVWQVEPLDVHGWAELLAGEIRLRGELKTVMEVPCARCLQRTRRPVAVDFDLFYRSVQTIAREEEVELRGDDLDIGFFQGDGLLLEDALREQVLLALPMKSICRSDCAGLCPQCGLDRNLGLCTCPPAATDDRWTPLAGLKP
jgi:uncharacterized protein